MLAMKSWKNVDEYIAAAPKDSQLKLREVRAAIREAAPDAVESISYAMPFYSFKGETGFKARLCYFGLLKNRVAFYIRPLAMEGHLDEVSEYQTTKSALQFPLDGSVPVSLIKKLVREGIKKHTAGEDDSHARGGKRG
jgi:uncharacterized protein YdhG (YjbR/CyaY superfamily)